MYLNKKIILIAALAMSQSVFSQEIDSKNKSLEESLDEKKAHFEANASDEKKRIYAEGINAVKESGVLESAINVGDKAPDFVLANAEGKEVSLYKELEKGPVVLMWYRGGWCPYCNRQLSALQEIMPELEEKGWQLIALSPDKPEELAKTVKNEELGYTLVSDSKMKAAKAFEIAFQVDQPTIEKYKTYKIDLIAASGEGHQQLPVPSVFLINAEGEITFVFSDPDYKKRLSNEALLEAVE